MDGNIDQPRMGLTPELWTELTQSVNVILNCAACTLFGWSLERISKSNVSGPMNVLEFASSCTKLDAFVHVSTAYVNCNQPHNGLVDEKLYELPIDVNEFYEALKRGDDLKRFETVMNANRWPNSYTISKAVYVQHNVSRAEFDSNCSFRGFAISIAARRNFSRSIAVTFRSVGACFACVCVARFC